MQEPLDIAIAGTHSPGEDLTDYLEQIEAVGATWWRDGWIPWLGTEHGAWMADVLEGPPVG